MVRSWLEADRSFRHVKDVGLVPLFVHTKLYCEATMVSQRERT